MTTAWYSKIKTRSWISRTITALALAGLFGVGATAAFVGSVQAAGAAGINSTINYQGRLLTATGAVVPDGTYNMEFQIWQDGNGCVTGCTSANAAANNGGTLKWTEDWVYGSGAPDNRITVKNGYFSANLGSLTALSGVNFNWNTLYLTTNIGNTSTAATFSAASGDGLMIPFKRMAANPYAINSGQLGGLTSAQFVQLGQGIQAASTTGTTALIGANQTSTGTILDLQKGGADVLLVDSSGSSLFRPTTDSQTALQVQKAGTTTTVFTVDTNNSRIGIGTATPAYAVDAVGSVNASTSLKVGGTDVCTSSGCTVSAASAIQNQNASQQTSSNYWISGTGRADTGLQSPLLDNPSGTIGIGTAAGSTSITIGRATTQVVFPGSVAVSGATNSGSNYKLAVTGSLTAANTGSQYGLQTQVTFTPTGGTLSNLYGQINIPIVGAGSTTITNAFGTYVRVDTAGGGSPYTGQITNAAGIQSGSPNIAGSNPVSNYYGLKVDANTSNVGVSGNTVTNYGIGLLVPAATGSYSTNYGINISGNGGSGATNYSLYNSSTAASYFAGSLAAASLTQNGNNVCDASGNCSGAGGYIVNSTSLQPSSNFNISGTGQAGSLLAASLDTATAVPLTIGTGTASAVTVGNSGIPTTVAASSLALNAPTITTNAATLGLFNSTATTVTALGAATNITLGATTGLTVIQNPTVVVGFSGPAALVGNGTGGFTIRNQTYSAASSSSGVIALQSGDVSGVTSSTGSVTVRSGASSTSGNTGNLTLGTGNAASGTAGNISIDNGTYTTGTPFINIGTSTQAHTIAIGTGGTAVQNVAIGSTSSASGTTIQGGTSDINLVTASTGASVIVKNTVGDTGAFQIQNSAGTALFNADTTNNAIGIGGMPAPGTLTLTPASGGSLAASTTYYYELTALDNTGAETAVSPENSAATTGTNKTITVSWSAVAGAIGYKLYRGTSAGGENTVYYPGNVLTYSDTGAAGSVNTPPASGSAAALHASATSFTYSNLTDSTAAFQVQNAAGKYIFSADTTNMRLNVGTGGTPTGQLYVAGTIAALGNIATPSSPAQNYDIAVIGKIAYVPNNYGSAVQAFDLTNPASPVSLNSQTIQRPTQLVAAGKYLYVATANSNNVLILDASNPASYVTLSTTAAPNTITDIGVQGKYMYLMSATGNAFYVYDVTNPKNPVLINTATSANSGPSYFTVSGKYLYSLENASKLVIYDISNPASFVTLSNVTISSTSGVTLVGRYLYMSTSSGMLIYDVSNPASPTSAGSLGLSGISYFASAGRYLYATVNNSIYAIDVSSPASPTVVSTYNTGVPITALAVNGRTAIVGHQVSLQTLDLGGEYAQAFEAGSAEVGSLNVDNGAAVNGALSVQGSLAVGDSLQVAGGIGTNGNVAVQTSTNSTTAFQVQNAAGQQIFLVDTATSQSGNYLLYGGFESGAVGAAPTGWTKVGTPTTFVRNVSAPFHYGGLASLQLVTTATANQGGVTTNFTGTVPTGNVTVSFYAEVGSGTMASNLFTVVSVDGTTHTQACTLGAPITATGFTRVICSLTTTGPMTSLTIQQNDATARTIYIDAAQVVAGTSATPATALGAIQLRGAVDSPVVFQALSNSTTAFQIQNTAGTSNLFVADTLNNTLTLGGSTLASTLNIGAVGTAAVSSTTNIGTGTGAAQNVVIGSNITTSSVTIDGGPTAVNSIAIGNSSTAHNISIATVGSGQSIAIGSANSTSQVQIAGGSGISAISLFTASGGNINVGYNNTAKVNIGGFGGAISTTNNAGGVVVSDGFSSSDGTITPLILDSSINVAEPANTCTASVNGGALYYNSTTNAIRGCINANWEDVVTTSGLGILAFGVVPDSGANAGDLQSLVNSGVSGPCKVSWASASAYSVAPCTAYSGGRKIIVAQQTAVAVTGMTTTNIWSRICLTGTNSQPALSSAVAAEATNTNLPAWSPNNPVLCLADIKGSATTANQIANIYDVRTFTNVQKTFATIAGTTPALGQMVVPSGSSMAQAGVTASLTTITGVVVAITNGTVSATAPSAIIATRGPVYIKTGAAFTQNQYITSSSTAGNGGYALGTATYALSSNYGTGRNNTITTCTAAATCSNSVYVDFQGH